MTLPSLLLGRAVSCAYWDLEMALRVTRQSGAGIGVFQIVNTSCRQESNVIDVFSGRAIHESQHHHCTSKSGGGQKQKGRDRRPVVSMNNEMRTVRLRHL